MPNEHTEIHHNEEYLLKHILVLIIVKPILRFPVHSNWTASLDLQE